MKNLCFTCRLRYTSKLLQTFGVSISRVPEQTTTAGGHVTECPAVTHSQEATHMPVIDVFPIIDLDPTCYISPFLGMKFIYLFCDHTVPA